MTRILAIDWSGARRGERSKIWLAEVRDDRMVRLEKGRTRGEVIDHVIEEGQKDDEFVVGLDFGFSFPEWFVCGSTGVGSVEELWATVARTEEAW